MGDSGIDTFAYTLAFDASGVLRLFNGDADVYMIDTVTGDAIYDTTLTTPTGPRGDILRIQDSTQVWAPRWQQGDDLQVRDYPLKIGVFPPRASL